MKLNQFFARVGVIVGIATAASAQVVINEAYISHAGTDTNEFVELKGAPGTSLAGHMLLVVEGDGASQGILDRAIDLSAGTIGASGFFVAGMGTVLPAPDLVIGVSDVFENGTDTFYLVTTTTPAAITALLGTNIVTVAPATQIPALATVLDSFGIVDAGYPATDAVFDGVIVLGPDGTFLPAGVVRCGDAPFSWNANFLKFDPLLPAPPPYIELTNGAANPTCGLTSPGSPFCFGDGSGTACPCGNNSPVGNNEGCLSSLGTGGKVVGTGVPSIAADTLVLNGSGMPSSSALYFQGTGVVAGGLGTVFGDGLRCAGGTIIRLGTKTNVGGVSQYPVAGDPSVSVRGVITVPGVYTYQVWYRNAAAFCTAGTFNLTNGWSVAWAL